MARFKVSGTALQSFSWDMEVEAKDALDAKVKANQAIYALYEGCHQARAFQAEEVVTDDAQG
jgi:uncharacterized ParB-like nuclease family protein